MSQVNEFLVSYGGLILFLIVFVEQSGVLFIGLLDYWIGGLLRGREA